MKRGLLYGCAKREKYNVTIFGNVSNVSLLIGFYLFTLSTVIDVITATFLMGGCVSFITFYISFPLIFVIFNSFISSVVSSSWLS
jgi:hypothetical protein